MPRLAETVQQFDPVALAQSVADREPLLIERVAKTTGMPIEDAFELFVETIRFMILSYSSSLCQKIPITPGLLIDDAWHEFILFTRLYAGFCQKHFKMFLHHKPGGTDEENHHQFERTLMLYGIYYGAPPKKYWGCQGIFSDATCGTEL